jgi:hypothetical protein
MSEIINIKDFYNHETRITIVENTISSIDQTLKNIDRRFDKIEIELKDLKKEMRSDFKWVLGLLIGFSSTGIAMISGLSIIMAHGFHWF